MDNLILDKILLICEEFTKARREAVGVVPNVAKMEISVVKAQMELTKLTSELLYDRQKLKAMETDQLQRRDYGAAPSKRRRTSNGLAGAGDPIGYLSGLGDLRGGLADHKLILSDARFRESALQDHLCALQAVLNELQELVTASDDEMAAIRASNAVSRLPASVLMRVFRLLDMQSLLEAGEVCRRWRHIVRSNKSLWSHRSIIFPARSCAHQHYVNPDLQTLREVPFLGRVHVSKGTIGCLKETNCKVLGIRIDPEVKSGVVSALKHHAEHLEYLFVCIRSIGAMKMLDRLRLRNLDIDVISVDVNTRFKFSGPLVEESRLEALSVRRMSPWTLAPLIRAHSVTLRDVTLLRESRWNTFCGYSTQYGPSTQAESKTVAEALAQCRHLDKLLIPCAFAFDFSGTSLKVQRLLLDASSCSATSGCCVFPPGSVVHITLNLPSSPLDVDIVRKHLYDRMTPDFRATLQSFTLARTYSYDQDAMKTLQRLLDQVPEFSGKATDVSMQSSMFSSCFSMCYF